MAVSIGNGQQGQFAGWRDNGEAAEEHACLFTSARQDGGWVMTTTPIFNWGLGLRYE